jgi:predicted nucleic acid-binding protein
MNGAIPGVSIWMLDSSTFINTGHIAQVQLLILLRSPLFFPEYVFRVELGANAHQTTRREAQSWVQKKKIGIRQLLLSDLDRISQLAAPRRIGLGEIACAILAEREDGGVLCDDHKGRNWLQSRLSLGCWQSVEDFLLHAAELRYVSEFDLQAFQDTLASNRYQCRYDLRLEHLRRAVNR